MNIYIFHPILLSDLTIIPFFTKLYKSGFYGGCQGLSELLMTICLNHDLHD